MPSLLTSQAVLLATAMAVSAGTLLLFELFRQKYPKIPQNYPPDKKQALRSCLSSVRGRNSGSEKKNKKKRVRFADDAKESKENVIREHRNRTVIRKRSFSCGDEIPGLPNMPPNRAALYAGILRDRVRRIERSY
ncbi:uncharacterized protein LOC127254693 isoform X1 [Andrographis paniculata]|uniref:uncharacterized protein LOC127254693 isoform X1 n=1 Tax=Andrographis paniculata TaxID=175694 RepID=UPI0021E96CD2|nr:uncharacterized protein LOC127254693 isoform X1 [Andrographis paniculata]